MYNNQNQRRPSPGTTQGQDRNYQRSYSSTQNRRDRDRPNQYHPSHNPNSSYNNDPTYNQASNTQQDQVDQFKKFNTSQPPTHPHPYPHESSQSHQNYARYSSGHNSSPEHDGMNGVPRVSVYDSYNTPGGVAAQQAAAVLPRQAVELQSSRSKPEVTPQLPNYVQSQRLSQNHYHQQQGLIQGLPAPKTDQKTSLLGTPNMSMSKMSPDDLLKNFRSLECAGCQRHFGYQSRTNKDLLYCAASCVGEHANCGPAIIEKEVHQQSVPLLPTPPLISAVPSAVLQSNASINDQRRPIQSGPSPAQTGGYGVPAIPHQEGSRNIGYNPAMTNSADYQNGSRNLNSSREQPVNRGSSGPRSNGYGGDGDRDRRTGASQNNRSGSNTAYGSRDRDRRGGGSGAGSTSGSERRGAPTYGARKVGDKTPFSVGDDDTEWMNADVVDRKASNMPPVATAALAAPKQQPNNLKDRAPLTAVEGVNASARGTQMEVPVKSPVNLPASNAASTGVAPAKTQPPVTPTQSRALIQIEPDHILSSLTPELSWTELEIGVPTVVARNFVNKTGDFFAQGFHMHKQATIMAEAIMNHMKSGNNTKLGKWDPKTLCLAPFSGEFYRGEVLGPSEGIPANVDIFFSDYGNIESVEISAISEIPKNLSSLPRLISHCIWDATLTKAYPEAKLEELFADDSLTVTPTLQIVPGQYIVQLGQYKTGAEFQVNPLAPKPVVPVTPPVPGSSSAADASNATPVAPIPVPPVNITIPSPNADGGSKVEPPKAQTPLAGPATPNSITGSASRFTGTRPTVTKATSRKKYMMNERPYAEKIKANLELFIGFTWDSNRYLLVGDDQDAEGQKIQDLIVQQRGSCDKLKPNEVPVLGEVLLGPYDGEYFRGVVKSVNPAEKTVVLEFIDFGDKATIKFDEIYIPNPAMMEFPNVGLSVILPKLDPIEDAEVTGVVADYISEPMQMQILDSDDTLRENVEVALWINNTLTLNAVVHKN